MIEFECPYCGKTLRASDDITGKMGLCHKCGRSVRVPSLK